MTMNEQTWLLRPDDSAWDAWVSDAPHDFYHLSAYHRFAEQMGEGEAYLAVHGTAERFFAWPYLLRDVDGWYRDATSVYGYPGPVGLGLEDTDFLARAWDAFGALWAGQRIATLFTRFHPILANHRWCESLHGSDEPAGGELLHLGRSVSIDLTPERDARRQSYQKNLRQEIRASERAGLRVELDADWAHYPTFAALYRQTMDRNQASGRYLFSDEYFDALRSALKDQAHLAVAFVDDEPACIMLFTLCNTIAQAHLTGVNPAFAKLSPLKALIDGVAELARSSGAQRLHLGAGRGGHEDSLFRFKSHFSSVHHEFTLGRWILNGTIHDTLVDKHCDTVMSSDGAFFPAYRMITA